MPKHSTGAPENAPELDLVTRVLNAVAREMLTRQFGPVSLQKVAAEFGVKYGGRS